jgi:DNA-binding SARP family transcriptional activator
MDSDVIALAQELRTLGDRCAQAAYVPGALPLLDRARSIASAIDVVLDDGPISGLGGAQSLPSRLPPLRVTNLGRFQIRRGGETLPACSSRKAVALFRHLLARRGRVAHKDELMTLLWDAAGQREAAHSLHVAVSALRGYLDPPSGSYLCFEAGYYFINPEAYVEDDVSTFRRLAAAADELWRLGDRERAATAYDCAIDVYGGDYSDDGLAIPWAAVERERLLARYTALLDRLGGIRFAQRQLEKAIDCYRAVLELDGYREDAHGRLMCCYWGLGHRHLAIQQYRACAELLKNDLGIEPAPALQALLADISSNSDPSLVLGRFDLARAPD